MNSLCQVWRQRVPRFPEARISLGKIQRSMVPVMTNIAQRLLIGVWLLICGPESSASEPLRAVPLIGYTQLQTDLSGGRHANVRTMRATLVRADGTGQRPLAEELVDGPNVWTQFAGWSPDGKQAIVSRGWQAPENAAWEEEHKTFRMDPGQWMVDSCLVDLLAGTVTNLTAVDRVSHYNGGLFSLPDGRGWGFTPLMNGISKPYVMDLDGKHKRDVSGEGGGFAYGYSASPDGRLISYHDNYQIYVANADGSNKQHIATGHPFNFGPQWSPDGEWLLFVSGIHHASHPHVVRRDGTGLKKLADNQGYWGGVLFLDVEDFHQGSSDLPVWSVDGKSVFYSAQFGTNVELCQVTLDGTVTQLTHSALGTLHYHVEPSADGTRLLYGSKRDGVRQLFVLKLDDRSESQLTSLKMGHGAMWPHWQPNAPSTPGIGDEARPPDGIDP